MTTNTLRTSAVSAAHSLSGPEWIGRGSRVERTNGNWWMVYEDPYSATLMNAADAASYIERRLADDELPKWKRIYYSALAAVG